MDHSRLLASLLAFAMGTASCAALSAEPYKSYDKFSSGVIDPSLWQQPDGLREVKAGALHLTRRGLRDTTTNSGFTWNPHALSFANMNEVTAIKATVRVNSIDLPGCAANPYTPSADTWMVGRFFRTAIGDVWAGVSIGKNAGWGLPANQMFASAHLYQCNDAICSSNSTIQIQDIGVVEVGQTVTWSIQWDQANKRFIVGYNQLPTIELKYTADVVGTPWFPQKEIQINNFVPNCLAGPRTGGNIDVTYDNVQVNRSAAP